MKKIIYILMLMTIQLYGQNTQKFTLNWDLTDYKFNSKFTYKIPHFDKQYFHYNDVHQKIEFVKVIPNSGYFDNNSILNLDIDYEIVNQVFDDLSLVNLKDKVEIKIETSKARTENNTYISFNPIIRIGNQIKLVKNIQFDLKESMNISKNSISQKTLAITSSVLKTGSFRKFYVERSGVYKLSKSFLSSLGVDVNTDPRNIKIYGNGGRMAPLNNSIPYPYDIEENAIQVIGESDGVFNDSDYILFYAEGVDNWNYESETHNNLYANRSYYYVSTSAGSGKRMVDMVEPAGSPLQTYTQYDSYTYHEVDNVNISRLGRKWFGEEFRTTNNQSFDFVLPNRVAGSPVSLEMRVATNATVFTQLAVKANSVSLPTLGMNGIGGFSSLLANEFTYAQNFIPSSDNITINLGYNNAGVPTSNCFLDYIILKGKSLLQGSNKQFRFQVNAASGINNIGEYQITNATNIAQVWNITDIYNVNKKTNNSQSILSFKANILQLQKYIVVDNADFYTPSVDDTTVLNQDLKGTIFLDQTSTFNDVDYLIITPTSLKSQADRVAAINTAKYQLNVKVVTLDKIYVEFGSGKQDIAAIRNFVRYVYQNASTPSKAVKYVCLMGDASFDYKDRIPNNTNFTPIFHALDSHSLVTSFTSDDFYGFMDAGEGDMENIASLDIAVGRILADSQLVADQMVNKIEEYHHPNSYGRWRNNLTFLSDDVDRLSDASLQTVLNNLSDNVRLNKPFFNINKIFMDAYVQETTSGGERYPKAKEAVLNSFEGGSLVFNYLGHGGEDGLAQERIFEIFDAKNIYNKYRYPLFVTVTCEFSRFDNPYKPSAGEYTYLNPQGGAVSMITTTREIGQSTGENLNTVLYSHLLSFGSNNYPSNAEALRLAKNSSLSYGNNVVQFLGDPAMKLAIPKPKIVLTHINGSPIVTSTDTLQALGQVTLSGEVTDENGVLLSSYNGELFVNIFDKDVQKTTLGNDGVLSGGVLNTMNFTAQGETIFRGNVSVNNGLFTINFVVPRDIRVAIGNGKASFYAKNNAIQEDQTGYNTDIKIGGVNASAEADTTPPLVRLYMNDETFVSGGVTNDSPLFLAFLEDEHGINTASGIGHDIVAYLDGDETKPYILNDYYETELNNYKKGKVKFPFRNLASGLHTLTFKAWDVYNNIITSEIQFIVAGDETLSLTNVLNYPNPFVNHTEFWFTHNKPNEPLDVQIQVMTITGKIVWSKNQTITNAGFTSRDITWDGHDDFGDKIGKGVYVYKLTVKSTLTNKKSEKIEKLVIL